ncbi:conserved hypothetical protein [Klebsiella variicola]|nr:conserved hypothetical protein [Klebsiella variicola]
MKTILLSEAGRRAGLRALRRKRQNASTMPAQPLARGLYGASNNHSASPGCVSPGTLSGH